MFHIVVFAQKMERRVKRGVDPKKGKRKGEGDIFLSREEGGWFLYSSILLFPNPYNTTTHNREREKKKRRRRKRRRKKKKNWILILFANSRWVILIFLNLKLIRARWIWLFMLEIEKSIENWSFEFDVLGFSRLEP